MIVAGVDERLELRLTDGRRLRVVGIEPVGTTPSTPDLPDLARTALQGILSGQEITMAPATAKPDRWGRVPAFVFVSNDPPRSVGIALLRAGWARATTEAAAHACLSEMRDAEEEARVAGAGLWRDPYYALLAPDDQAAFAEHAATMIVAQGRLTSVVTGPYRTKLIFAARPARMLPDDDRAAQARPLVATMAPRVVKVFGERGMDLRGLVGRDLRMRGLLDLRFGPELLITTPDAIEVLPVAPAGSRASDRATAASIRSP